MSFCFSVHRKTEKMEAAMSCEENDDDPRSYGTASCFIACPTMASVHLRENDPKKAAHILAEYYRKFAREISEYAASIEGLGEKDLAAS